MEVPSLSFLSATFRTHPEFLNKRRLCTDDFGMNGTGHAISVDSACSHDSAHEGSTPLESRTGQDPVVMVFNGY